MSRSRMRGLVSRRRAVPALALAALVGGVLVPVLVDGGAAGAAPANTVKAAPKTVKPPKGTTIDKSSVRTVNGKPAKGTSEGGTAVPKSGPATFLLELDTQATGATFKANRTRGVAAAKVAARGQLARVRTMQSQVRSALPGAAPRSKVVYSTSAVLAGIAVKTDAKYFESLKRISGVKAVYPVSQKLRSNAGAVPLQGGPAAWQATGATGDGIGIGIIDSGIDYTHADFAGPGTTSAYTAAKRSATGAPYFPSPKVPGGYDFAGDAYDGALPASNPNSQPKPDPNPLDCVGGNEGHGTHVAGSAGGTGVTADGKTYKGPYDTTTPFSSLRIGPGMAPEAQLYALRVFGCAGSTNLVGQALDWAADPNGDQDFSDHLDVVNMSLGSDFGDPQDGDSVASDRLSALVGTSVVASIGNGSDVYDVGGSPGNAPQVIGVAASDDGFAVVDALRVTAPPALATDHPASLSVQYDFDTKPGITNQPMSPVLADRDACATLSAADAAKVAGKVATVYADAFACGSVTKANVVEAAGAIGMVIISDDDTLESGINGNPNIPAILVVKSAGDAIAAQLNAGVTVTVTFGKNTRNAIKRNLPQDADNLASFSSRGIRKAGNVKPDVTAVGAAVFSAGVGTGNDGKTLGGTSMASPMVAGLAALVRQRHPDWTPAEVKADIMNTATADIYTGDNKTGDKYAPGRVGSGRIVAPDAVSNTLLAYVKDDPGAVSVSFGPVAVTAPVSVTKTVRIANKGNAAVATTLSYAAATTVPGVTYSVSPASATVDARSVKDVVVTMTADPTKMTKTIDPTVEAPGADNPRQFLAEASGRLIVAAGGKAWRVPVYAAPRPASTMAAAGELRLPKSGPTDFVNGALPLAGKAVAQGAGATRIDSLVTGLELQATSPKLPVCTGTQVSGCTLVPDETGGDFRYAGAVSDGQGVRAGGGNPFADGYAYFGVSNWGSWRTPTGPIDFAVVMDTNRDGEPDAQLVTARATDTDIMFTALYDMEGNPIATDGHVITDEAPGDQEIEYLNGAPGDVDTAIFDSDSLVLPVAIAALPGVKLNASRINYGIVSLSGYGDGEVDTVGFNAAGSPTLTIDVNRPALSLTGPGDLVGPTYYDAPGNLPVRKDVRAAQFDKALGLLLIHHHNVNGKRGQAVLVRQPSQPRLVIDGPTTVRVGTRFAFRGDVPGIYGINATGKVVVTRIPPSAATFSGTLVGGRVAGKTGAFPRGTYKLRLDYAGDSQYAPGSSATVTVHVI